MLRKFIREEHGLEWVEWGMVAALVTAAAVTIMAQIGGELGNRFATLLAAVAI